MLVLLPPSETKAHGGDGPPLNLEALSFPELTDVRRTLVRAVSELAEDVPASLDVLGLSPRQGAEVARNAGLAGAGTLPALARYTGVVYDALDVPELSAADLERANRRLAISSALFGLVGGGDPIPGYRLSAGSRLPGLGSLRSLWRPVAGPVLAARTGLVVDLRSGAYAALAEAPGAVTVRVLSEDEFGARSVVSHANKHLKGRLARALVQIEEEPASVDEVVEAARLLGLVAERRGPGAVDLISRLAAPVGSS
ncbi:YaaA family protein [Actinoalloteichus hoggarensis]|uniref:YaaA family protein n=1 Tax=Actinoalloteichus hoggarensis TaxID=1470176 RepID=UPI000B8A6FE6|nr:peroxide stress protein YaaA [Actinoalloteichus hoggarensis]